MPSIYLSPSTQEFNPYIIGGNEEYYMNGCSPVIFTQHRQALVFMATIPEGFWSTL